ncbi:MAG: 1-acyl-sn-glycerol-3-phosphate acyltransferase [bacterium]
MKRVWLHAVRVYLKIGLWFYFRRIHISGKEHLNSSGAAMILGNHQNALLDPLLIAIQLNEFGYFLARAGVFKKKLVARLLSTFNMLPVYRIRDGWSNLTQNNEVFSKAEAQLLNQKKLILFPEGSHSLLRRVRPLSKGFTRIVLGAIKKKNDLPLKIIPVGFNYQHITHFQDEVHICVGKPLVVSNHLGEKEHDSVINLKKAVSYSLKQLTVHIEEPNYDSIYEELYTKSANFLNPKSINVCVEKELTEYEVPTYRSSFLKSLVLTFYKLTILPVFLFWKYYVAPKIKEQEFIATFRFAVCVVLIPFWIICVTIGLHLLFGPTIMMWFLISMLALTTLASKL